MPPQGGIRAHRDENHIGSMFQVMPPQGGISDLYIGTVFFTGFKSCPRKGASQRFDIVAERGIMFQVMPPQGGIQVADQIMMQDDSGFKSCPRKGASP